MRSNPNKDEKDKDNGSLDTGIIALLRNTLPFINSLILSYNVFLIKQDTILHILEGIKET